MTNATQRLTEIEAQEKALAAEKADLLKASKKEDLETVKALIKKHSFGPTDLRGALKAKRKRSSGTAAKKTTGTPRKSAAKKKAK